MDDDYPAAPAPATESTGSTHGSVERLPGDYFRAMATLFLREHPEWSRGALARALNRDLATEGIRFHERTLKRQLAGSITSVPPELEQTLERLLLRSNGYRTTGDIGHALAGAQLAVAADEHQPTYLAVERILPLAQLWLHLNPGCSKRRLACRLHDDLARDGLALNIDSLQSALAGKKRLVRPAVKDRLLAYLTDHGIGSEAEARARWEALQGEVRSSLAGRAFVRAERFRRLCLLWRIHRKAASSRALAVRLRDRLGAQGMQVGLHHLQNLVNGRTRSVRGAILRTLEELIRQEVPAGTDLDDELAKAEADVDHAADLAWVKADSIVELARAHLAQHPETSMRGLALRVARTIRRMGYASSANTLQPILGGWKRKTRGFVLRAVLKQCTGRKRAHIPAEALLSPLPAPGGGLRAPLPEDPEQAAVARLALALRSRRAHKPVSLEQHLRAARRYLPAARSMNFLEFQSFRAERLFGISRDEARRLILRGGRVGTAAPQEDDAGDPLAEDFPDALE